MKNSLSILTVPAFDDNYLWIIHDGDSALVIDPGDANAILHVLEARQLRLTAILLTHHHADHTGGVDALLVHQPVPVYGPARDGIRQVDHALFGGDVVRIDTPRLQLQVIDVPGHTAGHIAYYAEAQHWLFSGDTLFAGGCGRLFEGTAAQMLASLELLAALPDHTEVYCAHEYTLSNLRFALAVEPDNVALQDRMKSETEKRALRQPTVPSQIGLEKRTNPFLRSRVPSVISTLIATGKLENSEDPVASFAALRNWKNHFA
ncbi:hydroxyacylglutathione hydrolase [Undibacterium rugosum]|uniref:hydroxyacylglutathione hydrolase n=1 Tax=Undibacterium rugosum TaxID=2762291 RepID=UPI001B827EFF|nr:hydroxyacylglutathione hydrolase [Undibacterium rugosum]MBR7777094.1 hydroxyacylglutathione hydrolase [Undibacterium rugosum]